MFKIIQTKNWKKLQDALTASQQQARELQEDLAEAKIVLDIRVKAKTRQLKEEALVFESKFEQRAKQLKEKIIEFEGFQKLMVGRELKMVELKSLLEQAKSKIAQLERDISLIKEAKKTKSKKCL